MALTIGVDVGGTKVAAGVVDEDGRILAQLKRGTPSTSVDRTADAIAEVVDTLRAAHSVAAVGIGAAGFIEPGGGTVRFAPNLAWRDEPLKAKVEVRVGLPTVVENDANAMAWGEYRFGAGRGEENLLALTVGTGIGGGIVLDGRLHRGQWGIAAEIGHIQMKPHGRRCGCGNRGCWEQYGSGRALVHEARELASVWPARAGRLLQLADGRAEDIEGPEVTAAAREGDPAALECFAEVGRWLGVGMADLAAVLDPGQFILGGGVSAAGDLLLVPTRAAYAESLTGRGHRPIADICLAELGQEAGLVGAADLARSVL